MKRCWFQDEDGTYYRNIPLIMAEQRKAMKWPMLHAWQLRKLDAEWKVAWRAGLIRKAELGRGDVLTQPMPFREAYPDQPGLWMLDEWLHA